MMDYYTLGVRHLWILNPVSLETHIWTPETVHPEAVALSISGTPVHIPLPKLFAELSDTD